MLAANQFDFQFRDSSGDVSTQAHIAIPMVAIGNQNFRLVKGSEGCSQKTPMVPTVNIIDWRPRRNWPIIIARIVNAAICRMVILKALVNPCGGRVNGKDYKSHKDERKQKRQQVFPAQDRVNNFLQHGELRS